MSLRLVLALALSLFACANPHWTDILGWGSQAVADDDGGSASGGSSSGGSSSSSSAGGSSTSDGGSAHQDWITKSLKSSRQGGKLKCRCGGFLGLMCSCRMVAGTRKSTKTVAKSRAEPQPARRAPELAAVGLTEADVAALQARGFTVLRRLDLSSVPGIAARLQAPSTLGAQQALREARDVAGGAVIARNDLYRRQPASDYRAAGRGCGRQCDAFELTAWTTSAGRCSSGAIVGVVDTAPDLEHPSLKGKNIDVIVTRSSDRRSADKAHGTGVVSLLVGDESSGVTGLAPGATVIVADAFHAGPDGDAADTFDLIAALEVLLEEGANVINMSLSGPDNEVLQRGVLAALQRGATLVAAAGRPDLGNNQGYPGRYDGVITVAAVDNRLRASRLSSRGQHISFAAPGVGVVVAGAGGSHVMVDGTSFAAPFVSAAYAMAYGRRTSPREITELLSRSARDLGAAGRDPVFGWGLIQYSALPQC